MSGRPALSSSTSSRDANVDPAAVHQTFGHTKEIEEGSCKYGLKNADAFLDGVPDTSSFDLSCLA